MTKREKAEQKQAAIETLRKMLQPGDTVYTILRHVSRSGMSRSIDLVIMSKETGEPCQISYLAARAMDERIDQQNGGIKIGGCGMDMGFALVSNLSYTLFPKGFGCIGKGERGNSCPSNDHSNGDRDYTPDFTGKHACTGIGPSEEPCKACQGVKAHSHWHQSGTYALRHRWM